MISRSGFLVAAAVIFLCSCRKQVKLEVRKGCTTPEVVECLQEYAFEEMSSGDVGRLVQGGIPKCFAERDMPRLSEQRSCLPLTVGTDRDREIPIAVFMTCSDNCSPKSLQVGAHYRDVRDVHACCKLGGHPEFGLDYKFGDAASAASNTMRPELGGQSQLGWHYKNCGVSESRTPQLYSHDFYCERLGSVTR